ncbi:MAG TPA: hypothetical protein VMS00_09960 [Acidimicrobiales bacterium]|nr:hypothetical protein [Acidimicrobiales bacterium]
MPQFNEFSKRNETPVMGDTDKERGRSYAVPEGRATQRSATAEPEVIELAYGAPAGSEPGSAPGETRAGAVVGARRGGTMLAGGDLLSDSEASATSGNQCKSALSTTPDGR